MALGQPVATAPGWSGEFWQDSNENIFGYMAVAWSDERAPQPPPGWRLVRSEIYEDGEVFVYRRVTDRCPVCLDNCEGCVTEADAV